MNRLLYAFGLVASLNLALPLTATAANPLYQLNKDDAFGAREQQRLQRFVDDPATVSITSANVEAGLIDTAIDELALVLPGGIELTAQRLSSQVLEDGDVEWVGRFTDLTRPRDLPGQNLDTDGVMFAVRSHDGVYANIHLASHLYRLRPVSEGRHALVEIDKHGILFEEDEAAYAEMLRNSEGDRPKAATLPPEDIRAITSIRVAVPYTPRAASALGNVGAEVNLAFSEANASMTNSGIEVSLVNAGVFAVSGAETTNYSTMLSRFRNSDGFYDNVLTERNNRTADIITAVVDRSSTLCGQAYGIEVSSSNAYAVVSYQCLSGNYTFVHEIGHLIGARHDNDPSTSPRAYAHGFVYSPGAWRTIMAVNSNTCCTRRGFFSNPNRTFNGVATGTASFRDNARVWTLRRGTVAAFR